MFFAFSTEQFHEGKTPLNEGEKYVSIGMGAFIPQQSLQAWKEGTTAIDTWFKSQIKGNKLRVKQIIYELYNHEAFYTGSIDDTLDALGPDYTRDEVLAAYRSEYKKANA